MIFTFSNQRNGIISEAADQLSKADDYNEYHDTKLLNRKLKIMKQMLAKSSSAYENKKIGT